MTQAILAAHGYSTRAIEIIIQAYKTFKQERAAEKLAKQTMKELARLTDKELNDIGLSRGDIWYVAHNQNDNLRGWV